MFELISRLRKRSPEERRRISFWTAVAMTLFIALVWLTTLSRGGISPQTEVSAAGAPAQGLWREMRQGTRAFIDSLKR